MATPELIVLQFLKNHVIFREIDKTGRLPKKRCCHLCIFCSFFLLPPPFFHFHFCFCFCFELNFFDIPQPTHTDTQTHRHTDTQTHRQPHTCVVHVIFFFWFQSLTSGELAFPSADANFGPALPSQGYTGMLAIGSPIHGCAPLVPSTTNQTQFVLLERGGDPSCEFDEKVQLSQECVSVLCV